MATSSILGGEQLPEPIAGKGTDALGPSDNSDSGSDAQGAYGEGEMDSDSDAAGTGERGSVEGEDRSGSDILPDRLELEPNASSADDADPVNSASRISADEEVEDGGKSPGV
jgi:hypothetical protein